ncbi:DUF938 domain-containing protein [Oceaniglobus ichthyenteri]|uniref:DUF938 domain-containing protein n=1 Tax=Oceaniglobus ichthyenteri TaxID=2136177 RepID=UPI000D35CF48|nr:DUF938 domain-containing protein [Oceaniglobus ichthyenteri]
MTDAPDRPRHTARYFSGNADSTADGRLFAPVFGRNFPAVLAALAPWLSGRSGAVLEIGCGTGQHAASFALAFPNLSWWPSDPDAGHRASARAWAAELGAPARAPLALDAATDWATDTAVTTLGPLSAVVSMNVIHIAPYAVTSGIINGAAQCLQADGLLIFYGPFIETGQPTTAGNASFDAGLRAENPAWGLRDVTDIRREAAALGLGFAALIAMPANNRLLIFRKE